MVILPGGDQQPPFDTLVINLDRDSARLEGVMASCAAVGITAERLAAVTPETLPDRMWPWFHTSDGSARGALMPGEIGCYASHLMAMEAAVARGRPLLVLEDDAILTPVMARLGNIMQAAPPDWGMLRLSCRTKQTCLRVGRGDGFDLVTYWRMANSSVGYVITPEGARQFLAAFPVRTRPVDEDMRRPWLHGVPSYGVVPEPVLHNDVSSSIDPQRRRETDGRMRFKAMGLMNGSDA
jgi:glycosyl transferase family 25